MSRSTSRRLVGRWFAALLALAAADVVFSSSAQAAGCATGHASGRSAATYRAVLEMLDADGGFLDPRGPAPADLPRPCTGAFCSGLPAVPFSTLPQAAPGGFDEWAITVSPILLTDSGMIIRLQSEPEPRAVHQADPIFHPPRLQASTTAH
jgi:hypothetical protein